MVRACFMFACIYFFTANSLYAADDYEIVISTSKQELSVVEGDHIVKQYHVAVGKGGAGNKRKIGDKKTPLGVYKIVDFKENSKFYLFMQLDYPNLLDAWYGYKNNIINANDFRKITVAYKTKQIPPQDTNLGGYIGIHGIGVESEEKMQIHSGFNWTNGCIALTNEEINELRQMVKIGTRVIIQE